MTERPTGEARTEYTLVDGLAYALARAKIPTPLESSRDYAERLAPLLIESGWREAAAAPPELWVDSDGNVTEAGLRYLREMAAPPEPPRPDPEKAAKVEEGWKQHQNPGYLEEASDIAARLSVPEYPASPSSGESARHYDGDNCNDPNHDAIMEAWSARATAILDLGSGSPGEDR